MQQFRPSGFKILPPVVKNLLILNGLFFLATLALNSAFRIDLVETLGLHYFAAEKFKPWQFITYMFMHSPTNFSHIFFNMFALWMFGNVLENVWGPKRFLTYYIITGIGAAIVHYVVFYIEISPVLQAIDLFLANPNPESVVGFMQSSNIQIASNEMLNKYNVFIAEYNALIDTNPQLAVQKAVSYITEYRIDFLNAPVVIGASGAVFGILLAFGMLFPNSLIYIYFAIPIKAKWFVMIYGALELFMGFYDTGSGVAHFAHLGGMIFGFILIKYWNKR